MREQLELLVQLQDIDNQLLELKQERGNLPETVERLRAEIEETTQLLDSKREEQLNAGKERRRIENEVELAKVSLKKYQDQLFKVSTNREYDAIGMRQPAASIVRTAPNSLRDCDHVIAAASFDFMSRYIPRKQAPLWLAFPLRSPLLSVAR